MADLSRKIRAATRKNVSLFAKCIARHGSIGKMFNDSGNVHASCETFAEVINAFKQSIIRYTLCTDFTKHTVAVNYNYSICACFPIV